MLFLIYFLAGVVFMLTEWKNTYEAHNPLLERIMVSTLYVCFWPMFVLINLIWIQYEDHR